MPLVENRQGTEDRRERHLYLTTEGAALESELSAAQRKRLRTAYKAAGPDAVQGFRKVLENIMDPDMRAHIQSLARDERER